MCTGSPPCPYSTAGTFAERRMRRAAPLPNSVRGSAWMLLSDTVVLLVALLVQWAYVGGCAREWAPHDTGAGSRSRTGPHHRVDHGAPSSPSPRQLQESSERRGPMRNRPG